MSEYAVLAFEHFVITFVSFSKVDIVRSWADVFELAQAFLAIKDRSVSVLWNHVPTVDVLFSSNDVLLYTASVIGRLAEHSWHRNGRAGRMTGVHLRPAWPCGLWPLWPWLLVSSQVPLFPFPVSNLIEVCSGIVRHPVIWATLILGVLGTNHLFEHFLLRVSRRGWVVTHMVRLVPWIFFNSNIRSV